MQPGLLAHIQLYAEVEIYEKWAVSLQLADAISLKSFVSINDVANYCMDVLIDKLL